MAVGWGSVAETRAPSPSSQREWMGAARKQMGAKVDVTLATPLGLRVSNGIVQLIGVAKIALAHWLLLLLERGDAHEALPVAEQVLEKRDVAIRFHF
jgi:hypothetical protein